MNHVIYVDGGGQLSTECYFSVLCETYRQPSKYGVTYPIKIERYLLRNLPPDEIPPNASVWIEPNISTNNISEYAAVYFALKRFYQYFPYVPITIYSDSQLVVNQVNGNWKCKKEHLKPWLEGVKNITVSKVELKWVNRDIIVSKLGH